MNGNKRIKLRLTKEEHTFVEGGRTLNLKKGDIFDVPEGAEKFLLERKGAELVTEDAPAKPKA